MPLKSIRAYPNLEPTAGPTPYYCLWKQAARDLARDGLFTCPKVPMMASTSSSMESSRNAGPLSKLESLPLEIIQLVFFLSRNADLPLASRILLRKLRGLSCMRGLTTYTIGEMAGFYPVTPEENAVAQSRLFASRFFTYDFFRRFLFYSASRLVLLDSIDLTELEWREAVAEAVTISTAAQIPIKVVSKLHQRGYDFDDPHRMLLHLFFGNFGMRLMKPDAELAGVLREASVRAMRCFYRDLDPYLVIRIMDANQVSPTTELLVLAIKNYDTSYATMLALRNCVLRHGDYRIFVPRLAVRKLLWIWRCEFSGQNEKAEMINRMAHWWNDCRERCDDHNSYGENADGHFPEEHPIKEGDYDEDPDDELAQWCYSDEDSSGMRSVYGESDDSEDERQDAAFKKTIEHVENLLITTPRAYRWGWYKGLRSEDQPSEDQPSEDQPSEDQPSEDQPSEDQLSD